MTHLIRQRVTVAFRDLPDLGREDCTLVRGLPRELVQQLALLAPSSSP